jgi:hypothetical protein
MPKKTPDQSHLPVTLPSDEFRQMQAQQRTRQRQTVNDVKPTINRINKDQVKGGARPSKA